MDINGLSPSTALIFCPGVPTSISPVQIIEEEKTPLWRFNPPLQESLEAKICQDIFSLKIIKYQRRLPKA